MFRMESTYRMEDLYLLAGISRQGHMQAIQRQEAQMDKEQCYIGFIEQIRQIHPGMGLRKMYEQFNPEGIGRDAFISMGLRQGYRLYFQSNTTKTTWSVKSNKYQNLLINRRFTDVNRIWVSDITYYDFGGQFYYIILIMDVYSRRIIGYKIADNMRAVNNVRALEKAFIIRGVDDYQNELIHHSDRGSQYISDDYTNMLSDKGIRISMCQSVYENTHCERVNGTIKNEYLRRWDARTPRQLFLNLDKAVESYNQRKHNSIGTTPIDYEIKLLDISHNERKVVEIYTDKCDTVNPNQLLLDFE